ncbi:MAG: Ppx/GppA phosphatase family protein [Desulfuromonadales bacterium]|nr:Ppx/GppA phosphatase family protein [Desulfuromonadales bacterium]
MKSKRLAAIDIGTNSIRSIVVEADGGGSFRILDDEKVTVRLGEGMHRTGRISAAAIGRAIEALSRQKKIIDAYQVHAIEAVATSAVRKASNGEEFIQAIKDQIGLTVTTISGAVEAELAALSAFNNFDLEGTRHLLVDIGGGSLELITTVGQHVEETFSLDLGALYLTDSFLAQDPISVAAINRLRRQIRKELRAAFGQERAVISALIGSGGTITAMAAMITAARKEAFSSVHGCEILRSDVVHLLAMLLRRNLKERRNIPGLNPDRADIIVAGVTVIDELLEFFQVNLLKVNEQGIREGLILRGLRKHGMIPAEKGRRTWRDSAIDFATSCHFDKNHALQVVKLAKSIFKVVSRPFKLGEGDERLLEAAAILHDVGYFINYSSHHKHSYHLISHADLFGFTPRERELIANIARYHRKSIPKKKHEAFMRLALVDRQRVEKLAGILRLADGLDRSRTGVVEVVDAILSPSRLLLHLQCKDDPAVELYGGTAKSDLFCAAFQLQLVLQPAKP